jgi:hypothetical protein
MTQNSKVRVPLLSDVEATPYTREQDVITDTPVEPLVDPKVKEPAQSAAPQEGKPEDNHDYKKRWSDLKKRYDTEVVDLRRKMSEVEDKVQDSPDAVTDKIEAPKTPEELERFKQEEPKLYELFKSIAQFQSKEDSQEVRQKLDQLEEKELKLAKQEALKYVKNLHKDFDKVSQSDDFHDWAENQPDEVQRWVYENATDGQLLARALDLYKNDVSKIEKNETASAVQKDDAPDASSLVSTRSTGEPSTAAKKVWTETEIRKMSMAEYDRLETELDKAASEGRIIPG